MISNTEYYTCMLVMTANDDQILETSSSSEDEDVEVALAVLRRVKKRNTIKNYFTEVIPTYTEEEFVKHFRIHRNLATQLAKKFAVSTIYQNLLKKANSRANITPERHIIIFLWFAGHQTSSFRDVADRFDLSISSLHSVITRIIKFLSELAAILIKWPDNESKERTKNYFFHRKRFPNVIGAVDGSHIRIDKPATNHMDYCNRKNYYSLILQGTCNENLKFIDIFIGFPGSVHDARVFKSSTLYNKVEHLNINEFLLGDSAYPLSNHLLTPYKDNGHLLPRQKYYNTLHSSCRVIIEHTFGLLKQRFRQLYHIKLKGHARISHFIRACCALHNLADNSDLELIANETIEEQPSTAAGAHRDEPNAVILRDTICNEIYINRN